MCVYLLTWREVWEPFLYIVYQFYWKYLIIHCKKKSFYYRVSYYLFTKILTNEVWKVSEDDIFTIIFGRLLIIKEEYQYELFPWFTAYFQCAPFILNSIRKEITWFQCSFVPLSIHVLV